MLFALCLVLLNFVYGKENFQVLGLSNVTNDEALERCFVANLCTLETGCCNGHGVCHVNGPAAPVCVCGTVQDCRPGSTYNYTGPTCDTAAIDEGCCKSGSDDYIFAQSGVCNKRDGTDPESGSKGRLLKRVGGGAAWNGAGSRVDSWYNDSVGSFVDSPETIESMISNLTGTARGIQFSAFNMMALGFLQIALKDIVHYAYYPISEQNITINGTVYPKIRKQENTGITVGSIKIPKQFENTATAVVDVGPLYDYATDVSGGPNPYIDVAPAVTYWSETHHAPREFIVALKFYGLYHNYVARNVEEYFCGNHSLSSSGVYVGMANTCTVSVADQYELARRSTIRFSQNLLQQSILQFTLENPSNTKGLDEIAFDWWFRRDTSHSTGFFYDWTTYEKVRSHQEFMGEITRTDLSHSLVSGLDFWLSVRNPEVNTTVWDMYNTTLYGENMPCGFTPSDVDVARDVLNLFNTKAQRFGSQIHWQYSSELGAILTNANELGLSYKAHVEGLTDSPPLTGLTYNHNVYFGAYLETNGDRQYANTTPSVVVAATVALGDAIMVDRTGYWTSDPVDGRRTAVDFHPNPELIQDPAYGFDHCYTGAGSECTPAALNAVGILTGQLEQIDPNWATGYYDFRTRGALMASPVDWIDTIDKDAVDIDPTMYVYRQPSQYQTVGEILQTLFYQYDGMNSMAMKNTDSSTYFIPAMLTDSIPTNVGYSSKMDGVCFTENLIQGEGVCSRQRSVASCFWSANW